MTATTVPTTFPADSTTVAPEPVGSSAGSTAPSAKAALWKAGLAAGAVAAVATTAVAEVARMAGVALDIDGESIPVLAFAQMTLLATIVGVLIARSLAKRSARPQARFLATTAALTALSVVPDLTASTDGGSRAALVLTHLVAAAIVIPVVARRLLRHR